MRCERWFSFGAASFYFCHAARITWRGRRQRGLFCVRHEPICAHVPSLRYPKSCGGFSLAPSEGEGRGCSVCSVTLSRQYAGVPGGAPAWCRLTATGMSGAAGLGGGLRWAWVILGCSVFSVPRSCHYHPVRGRNGATQIGSWFAQKGSSQKRVRCGIVQLEI